MRYKNKSYWRIPFGEIQYGHLTRSIVVWVFGRKITLRKGI